MDKDPIRFEGGFNWYTYADNDPINKIDPSGLDATKINPLVDLGIALATGDRCAAGFIVGGGILGIPGGISGVASMASTGGLIGSFACADDIGPEPLPPPVEAGDVCPLNGPYNPLIPGGQFPQRPTISPGR